MNSRIDGQWGRVVKLDRFPYASGKKFSLSAKTAARYFTVRGNGEDLYLYDHRIQIEAIKRICVTSNHHNFVITTISANVRVC